jgi:hypothetical protein
MDQSIKDLINNFLLRFILKLSVKYILRLIFAFIISYTCFIDLNLSKIFEPLEDILLMKKEDSSPEPDWDKIPQFKEEFPGPGGPNNNNDPVVGHTEDCEEKDKMKKRKRSSSPEPNQSDSDDVDKLERSFNNPFNYPAYQSRETTTINYSRWMNPTPANHTNIPWNINSLSDVEKAYWNEGKFDFVADPLSSVEKKAFLDKFYNWLQDRPIGYRSVKFINNCPLVGDLNFTAREHNYMRECILSRDPASYYGKLAMEGNINNIRITKELKRIMDGFGS